MARFVINRSRGETDNFETTVEAARYRQEGDYFVFYADPSRTKTVLTVKASMISTIHTDPDN